MLGPQAMCPLCGGHGTHVVTGNKTSRVGFRPRWVPLLFREVGLGPGQPLLSRNRTRSPGACA